jgi:RimJ/RimL family protein N-acetyltransferase
MIDQLTHASRAAADGPVVDRTVVDGTMVRLRDGSQVLIRQVRASDAAAVADGFASLSTRSRWQRFLAPKARLSAAELRYLTDVDHYDHEAIGAATLDGRGVGIARYIRSRHDPRSAEIAVTVVDAWQGRGLGTELTRRLTRRARHAGIERFTALVSYENAAAAGLLRAARGRMTGRDHENLTYEVPLTSGQDHDYGFGAILSRGKI